MKSLGSLIPFVLIALVFWFLIVRPQRRRQQEMTNTQASLGPGTEVMLGSGIFGTVVSLDEETVHLQVAPGTTLKVAKQAVIRVITAPDTVEEQGEHHEHGEPEAPGENHPSDDPSDRHDQ